VVVTAWRAVSGAERLRWRLVLREAPGEEEVSSNLSAREP